MLLEARLLLPFSREIVAARLLLVLKMGHVHSIPLTARQERIFWYLCKLKLLAVACTMGQFICPRLRKQYFLSSGDQNLRREKALIIYKVRSVQITKRRQFTNQIWTAFWATQQGSCVAACKQLAQKGLLVQVLLQRGFVLQVVLQAIGSEACCCRFSCKAIGWEASWGDLERKEMMRGEKNTENQRKERGASNVMLHEKGRGAKWS